MSIRRTKLFETVLEEYSEASGSQSNDVEILNYPVFEFSALKVLENLDILVSKSRYVVCLSL